MRDGGRTLAGNHLVNGHPGLTAGREDGWLAEEWYMHLFSFEGEREFSVIV